MPGLYGAGEYDLAGFCVGVVEEENLIDGSTTRTGDVMIGLASSGIHSNGLSLARKVLLGPGKLKVRTRVDGLEDTVGEELLKPTRIYVKPVLNIIKNFQYQRNRSYHRRRLYRQHPSDRPKIPTGNR